MGLFERLRHAVTRSGETGGASDRRPGTSDQGPGPPVDEREAERIHDRMAGHQDDATQREAFERELAERGSSDTAGEVGDHIE